MCVCEIQNEYSYPIFPNVEEIIAVYVYICVREKERDKQYVSVCMCIESGTTASIALDYSEDGDNEIFNPDKRDSLSLITSTVKYVCLKHGTDAKKLRSNDGSP